ncbi:hypothetical protein [Ureibacillus xyleni]|nr:hypothetical protein [Ureibacillus xyleni]
MYKLSNRVIVKLKSNRLSTTEIVGNTIINFDFTIPIFISA